MYEIIRINTINEARQMLFDQEYQGKIGRNRNLYVYRGLPDPGYALITSLQRICKNKKKTVEGVILDNFAKYAELEMPSINQSIWRKMILGQHHGLPTRLLDWSRSPLMALHFATTEGNMDMMDQRDCVVWRLDIEKLNNLLPEKYKNICKEKHQQVFTVAMLQEVCDSLDAYDKDMGNNSMVMLEPPTIDQRIANQYSFFSVVPSDVRKVEDLLEKCEEGAVRKYIISKNLRWEIRDMLDQVNVNERTVYPGLDGIATWLGRHYFARDLSKLRIRNANIATVDADVIVNPTNKSLSLSGSTSKSILHYAGKELKAACSEHKPINQGDVVQTPAFNLKSQYIFHTAGVKWDGEKETEFLMRGLYRKSLYMAKEMGCHSIAFPLLGSGSFGCPDEIACRIGFEECYRFLTDNNEYALDIIFCVIEEKIRLLGEGVRRVVMGEAEELSDEHMSISARENRRRG